MHSSARISRRSGGMGSRTRRQGGRSAMGRFSVGSWERGEQLHDSPQPELLGFTRKRISTGSSCGSINNRAVGLLLEVLEGICGGELTSRTRNDPSIVSELRRIQESGGATQQRTAGSTSTSGQGTGGHPALQNKLVRRALAYGIDRVAIVRRLYGELDQAVSAERQRRLPRAATATTGRTGTQLSLSPGRARQLARAGGLPAR